jgi:hypothetical protein
MVETPFENGGRGYCCMLEQITFTECLTQKIDVHASDCSVFGNSTAVNTRMFAENVFHLIFISQAAIIFDKR